MVSMSPPPSKSRHLDDSSPHTPTLAPPLIANVVDATLFDTATPGCSGLRFQYSDHLARPRAARIFLTTSP